jgi:hypothetical protein
MAHDPDNTTHIIRKVGIGGPSPKELGFASGDERTL